MRAILPAVFRIANVPGKLLARTAMALSGVFLVLSFFAWRDHSGLLSNLLFALAIASFVASVAFAFRRYRLQLAVDVAEERLAEQRAKDAHLPAEKLSFDDEVRDNVERLTEFQQERRIYRDTWMPGVEATQRALTQAAGGIEAAPYLRDDLRITGLLLLGTLVALPVSALGIFFALLQILG